VSGFDQSFYQVRLDWGREGLARLAPADIVVVVDVLPSPTRTGDAAVGRERLVLDESAPAGGASAQGARAGGAAWGDGAPAGGAPASAGASGRSTGAAASAVLADTRGSDVLGGAEASGALIMAGSLRNAGAVAKAVVAEQHRRGGRVSVTVLPLGEADHGTGTVRFAVEDHLGAGAIVAALGALGIDHTSPEAAVASESFRGLRTAIRHLLTASGSGRELIERHRRDEVLHAAEVDAVDAVAVLRDGVFRPM